MLLDMVIIYGLFDRAGMCLVGELVSVSWCEGIRYYIIGFLCDHSRGGILRSSYEVGGLCVVYMIYEVSYSVDMICGLRIMGCGWIVHLCGR